MNHYQIFILEKVRYFLDDLSTQERAKIYARIEMMKRGSFEGLDIKILKQPLKELRFKQFRIFFFIHNDIIYIISSFIKKSQKTPKNKLVHAHNIIKTILTSYDS